MGTKSNQYKDRVAEVEDKYGVSGPFMRDTLKTREHEKWVQQLLNDAKINPILTEINKK